MEPSGLEFYTATELIRELMRRPTFLGVVIQAEEEYKNRAWGCERMFKVHFNENLDAEQAHRLLEAIASRMDSEAA
jgi:hypothetical protein